MNLYDLIPQLDSVDEELKLNLTNAWQNVFKHDIDCAMQFAQQAAKLAPDSPEVIHLLGLLASRDGRSDIALPLLQNALKGGVTERRLRDMAEALLIANQPLAALAPLNDSIRQFGNSAETLGLLSAVQVALEDFYNAKLNAYRAIQLQPHLMAWDSNLAFCQLIQGEHFVGLKTLTARVENLALNARVPTLNFSEPCDVWLKNEQGPGDTLFNLRFAPTLVNKGFKLHIQTDKKTKTLLQKAGLFASVNEEFSPPDQATWFNVGDLPLAGMQANNQVIVQPLALMPEPERVGNILEKLQAFGPAPYFAVTWRAGPRGKKQRNGLRMFNKSLPLDVLGEKLSAYRGTIVSIQRLPEIEENIAFKQALGREFLDLSKLNDNLQDMLALLSVVDCYIAAPNTNVHLRESLGKSTEVFVNRPYQDWRWQAEGEISPWYPNSYIYRQEKGGDWGNCFHLLNQRLLQKYETGVNQTHHSYDSEEKLLNAELKLGWEACDTNHIQEAVKVAQSILKIKPDFAPALNLLGWTAYRDDKVEIALGVLQQAVNLAPNNGKIIGDLIRVLTADKQHSIALSVAEQALANGSLRGRNAIYYARAATYAQLNQLENAIADYEACSKISPDNLDAACYNGMARLKFGDPRNGFRLYSSRPEARLESRRDGYVCPWLRGNVAGLKVLIKRDMGLGDELTFLRYLPWLTNAGVKVDYWCGHKLLPVLQRSNLFNQVISDQTPLPDSEHYDLTFWVHELPVAVEALGSPEIASPFQLTPLTNLVNKWRDWLSQCGPAPYIGLNWRAGAVAEGAAKAFSKLAKSVDAKSFAITLSGINATFISLQRNVMMQDVMTFEQHLKAKLHDAASLTDDIEDLLALLSLLDENIGVSNTNMHLRAGLDLGSRVLVQNPGGDWRWGFEGDQSLWFNKSKVYRQSLDQTWEVALHAVRQDLLAEYGELKAQPKIENELSNPTYARNFSKKIIWITAGNIEKKGDVTTSNIASARYRVIIPSQQLESLGWQNLILNEGLSKAMGGWCGMVPQADDIVVVSKVFTEHTITLIEDAKARGAYVIVDHCDNFFWIKERGVFQRKLCKLADLNTVSTQALSEVMLQQVGLHSLVVMDPTEHVAKTPVFSPSKPIKLLWFGHDVNYRALNAFFDELKSSPDTYVELTVITDLLEKSRQHWDQISIQNLSKRYVTWRTEIMEREFARCDLVIIPIREDEYGSVKSSNRLTESIQAGKFVVAHPLPSYLSFSEHAYIGQSILGGIQWAVAHPQEALKRIHSGQKFIQENYAPSVIAESWQQAFFEVRKLKVLPHRSRQTEPDKLAQLDTTGRFFEYFQSTEASRILAVTSRDDLLKQQYAEKFPLVASAPLQKIAVYTAIFGGYDTAPLLQHVDQELDYILFTDSPDFKAPAPWQVRVVSAVFEDPQVDARRIKALSHEFLPEYDVAVWIDGNFLIKELDRAFIHEVVNRAPIALCKHQFRDCIYEEAAEILKRGIDASTPVIRQMQYYQARQFPAKFGLHATSFLVRNHLDSATIRMNMRWWEILSANSKRDQLSFDYVRWEQNVSILPLPFNLRDNALYVWGKQGIGKHEVNIRRNDEHTGRSLNYQSVNADERVSQPYDARFDAWPKSFLLALKQLNEVIAQYVGEKTKAESLFYYSQQPFIHALPDPRKGEEIRACLMQMTQSKNVLHLGFDAGYLILLSLHFSEAKNVIARDFVSEAMLPVANWFSERFSKHVGLYSELKIDSELLAHFDVIVIYQQGKFDGGLSNKLLANVKQGTLVMTLGHDLSEINNDVTKTSLTNSLFVNCIRKN